MNLRGQILLQFEMNTAIYKIFNCFMMRNKPDFHMGYVTKIESIASQ